MYNVEKGLSNMTKFTFAVQQLIEAGDWETLASMLRNTQKSVELRKQAALAIAEVQVPEGGEALLEAIFHDPSQEVRDAAFDALKALVGPDTSRLAVESYGEEPAPLGDEPEGESSEADDEDDPTAVRWEASDVVGLSNIISAENNPTRRIKAVRAMGTIAHMDAVNYLVYLALWEEDDAVRKAAYDALKERYGDDLDNFLAEERKTQLASEGMTEEDLVELSEEEEADEPGETGLASSVPKPPVLSGMGQPPSVIQEENPGKGFLLALVGLAVMALIVYLIFFS